MKPALMFLLMFFVLHSFAQTAKDDIVLKLNGDEMVGKVTEIGDDNIKFIYKGETLLYQVKKTDILKITYASGRIEFFNKPALPSESGQPAGGADANRGNAQPSTDHHNKVAILPFTYLIDKQDAGEEMTYKVQSEAYSFLKQHIGMLELQDPNTTNALLIKAGVTGNNVRGFTMGEVCNILGVELLIQGSVTQNKTTATNTVNSSTSYKDKNQSSTDKNGNGIGTVKGSSSSSTVASSTQNYQTSMTMNVFNDKGDNLFTKDHTGFWWTEDAYKITLQYLLKKTPVYKK